MHLSTIPSSARRRGKNVITTLTTLPATNQSGSKELTTFLGCQTRQDNRILVQEVVEFGHELEKVSERQEASINRPSGSGSRVVVLNEDDVRRDGLLSRVGFRVETCNSWIRDSIQETKTERQSLRVVL